MTIAAVLQRQDGSCKYWALRHLGVEADFHRRDGFASALSKASRASAAPRGLWIQAIIIKKANEQAVGSAAKLKSGGHTLRAVPEWPSFLPPQVKARGVHGKHAKAQSNHRFTMANPTSVPFQAERNQHPSLAIQPLDDQDLRSIVAGLSLQELKSLLWVKKGMIKLTTGSILEAITPLTPEN